MSVNYSHKKNNNKKILEKKIFDLEIEKRK